MAIITSPGTRILDASGNPVNGGKFRVYTQNTTTLATLYSDAALTVTRANPVVANSAGELPFFFLASGAYDCAQLDASNGVLDSQDDVPAWGEDTGTLDRTVSGNGRFQVTGAAGQVYIRIGDPSPDNSGGTGVIEGWAGTQADSLTIDSALVNAGTSSGALKENSKKLIGVVQTEATTFTAAATVPIELTNQPTGVRAWEVEVFDLLTSATISLRLDVSFDGGSTYKAGATDYTFSGTYYDVATNVYTLTSSTGAALMDLSGGVLVAVANKLGRVFLRILTPSSGSNGTLIDVVADTWTSDGFPARNVMAGMCQGASFGRATHIRLVPSAGNITGKYLVRPLRGYGEA